MQKIFRIFQEKNNSEINGSNKRATILSQTTKLQSGQVELEGSTEIITVF